MAEEIDNELAQIEAEIQALENNPTGATSSIAGDKPRDTLIHLGREMIQTKDTRKFANLLQKYIGFPKLPINTNLEIATYCEVEGLDELAKVFREEAETMLATSLSIEGFFARLLVTQIKKDEKSPENKEQKKKSWGLFKKDYGVDANG